MASGRETLISGSVRELNNMSKMADDGKLRLIPLPNGQMGQSQPQSGLRIYNFIQGNNVQSVTLKVITNNIVRE